MMKPDEMTVWAAILLENSDFYLFMYFAVNAISLWLLFFFFSPVSIKHTSASSCCFSDKAFRRLRMD